MSTINEYIQFRGDLNFKTAPVNEIDEMVFASLGKADYTGILEENECARFGDVFGEYLSRHNGNDEERVALLASPELIKTLHEISMSPRYADIKVAHFVNRVISEREEQFSALTVLGPDGKIYVTFRGTDDSLIGWKENFMLSVVECVAAQSDAVAYLEAVAKTHRGKITVLGHSKGGNLAIYAASKAKSSVRKRIEKVISYDGPGFSEEFLTGDSYLEMKDRITTMVPTASLVGMLLNQAGDMEIIRCGKTGIGAHNLFSWELDRNGFLRDESISEKSLVFRNAIYNCLEHMDMEERQQCVNDIFEALSSTGACRLTDFTENTFEQTLKVAGKFGRSEEIKEFITLLSRFVIAGRLNSTIEDLQEKFQHIVVEPVAKKRAERQERAAEEAEIPAESDLETEEKLPEYEIDAAPDSSKKSNTRRFGNKGN